MPAAPSRVRHVLTVAGVTAVLLLLLGAGVPFASASPSVPGDRANLAGASSTSSSAPGGTVAGVAPASLNCSLLRQHFGQLYPGLGVPPGIPNATFGGCAIGADDASLSMLSQGNGSGSDLTFHLALPPVGSTIGSSYAMISLRLAVTGMPCSLDGASVLSVELVPPLSPLAGALDPNWSVRTPAFDLAPSASCDNHCSNDTALWSVEGAWFCEDELLPAAFVPVPGPGFAPGSSLVVALAGTVGGTGGLGLWINDSASPSSDVARVFSSTNTSLGRPLEPLAGTAGTERDLWDGAGAVSVASTDCPLPAGATVSCTSYDPALDVASGSVALLNATFGPAPGHFYSEVATSSSTAACGAVAPACVGFDADAGDVYPSYWLSSDSGTATFEFGNGPPTGASSLGGAQGQFAGGGSAPFLPILVEPAAVTTQLSSADVSASLIDFSGVANVTYIPYYCDGSTTPTATPIYAQLSAGNATDGTWNASFPTGLPTHSGDYSIAYALGLSNGSSVYGGRLTSFDLPLGTACVFPAPSPPTVQNVTATSLGYRVTFNDPGGPFTGFEVNATGGSAPLSMQVAQTWTGSQGGNLTATVSLGAAGAVGTLNVTAEDLDGASSAPSGNATGTPTLSALSVSANATPSTVVGPGTTLNVSVDPTGGVGPYEFTISLGDGSGAVSGTIPSAGNAQLPLGSYQGTLDIRVNVTDAAGDTAAAPAVLVPVEINPLSVPQSSQAGDGFVSLSWGSAHAPGLAVIGYFVYSTTNLTDAWSLASAGVSVGTFGGIEVSYTANHSTSFLVPDGGALYAQVVALCASGLGDLPAGNLTLVGRPAPFLVSAIDTVGGGVAPFTDDFSASVTGGSNDSLLSAIFSFPGFVEVAATIAGGNGSFEVNASYDFLTPGTFSVSLHVTDDEYDLGIVSTTVFVAPGVPPALAASVLNAPAYNGTPVLFEATASGGSGEDGFNWSFGDGAYANASSPVHIYALPGTYSAVVRVTDLLTQGVNVTVLPVTVFAAPVVFVSVFPGPNGTDSFDFRASVGGGSGPSQVVWTFGDGSGVGHGYNVTHDYDAPGTYPVNVTATDPAGHAGSTELSLYVAPPAPTGGGGTSGIAPVYFWIVIALASGVVLVAIVLAVRQRPPPEAEPVGDFEEEDGAVRLS
jgi:PKD repeat protein